MSTRMQLGVALMLVMSWLGASAQDSQALPLPRRPMTLDQIAAIRPYPKITKDEALEIGWLYFNHEHGACGVVRAPKDLGTEWSMEVGIGIIDFPDPDPIKVEKATGRVRWGNRPEYATVQAFVEAMRVPRKRLPPPDLGPTGESPAGTSVTQDAPGPVTSK